MSLQLKNIRLLLACQGRCMHMEAFPVSTTLLRFCYCYIVCQGYYTEMKKVPSIMYTCADMVIRAVVTASFACRIVIKGTHDLGLSFLI